MTRQPPNFDAQYPAYAKKRSLGAMTLLETNRIYRRKAPEHVPGVAVSSRGRVDRIFVSRHHV